MKTHVRRRVHVVLAWFFALQVPPSLWLAVYMPVIFDRWWKLYLVFLSLYAIVSTHWAGASAETPTRED